MEIISIELLGEVYDSIDIRKSRIEKDSLFYYDIYGNFEKLDIRGLVFDFIMYANKHGFTLKTYFSNIDNGWLVDLESFNGLEVSDEIECSIYDNGWEAIFKACEWISKNIES